MTGGICVNGALELIKVIRPGQTPATSESTEALAILNRLVDSWSTERLLIPVVGSATYALTAAQGVYPIGLTAAAPFNVARPIRIDAAGIVQTLFNAGAVNFRSELDLITERDYQALMDKGATADVPQKLYYSPGLANGTLYLWPIPNVVTATSLELSTWTALSSFPDLVTDVAVAPRVPARLDHEPRRRTHGGLPGGFARSDHGSNGAGEQGLHHEAEFIHGSRDGFRPRHPPTDKRAV